MTSTIVGAFASSHAVALMRPPLWDSILNPNRGAFHARYGRHPKLPSDWGGESIEQAVVSYDRFERSFRAAVSSLKACKPTALIIVGGDQDEDLVEVLPQFAFYTGQEFLADDYLEDKPGESRYFVPVKLTEFLHEQCLENRFDVSCIRRLPRGKIKAHAFGPLLKALDWDPVIPVAPLYIETLHTPSISPQRCFELGALLRRSIERFPGSERVVVCASGGLSHFTASYPFDQVESGLDYGAISTDFDAMIMREIIAGKGAQLVNGMTSKDLTNHGEVEFRPWAAVLGAVGERKPKIHQYEPIFNAGLGMAVCYWDGATAC